MQTDGSHIVYPPPPAYSSEGSLVEGTGRDWCVEDEGRGGKGGGWVLAGRRPSPALLKPTSAARPILTDLKAVSAETKGAISRHDAAVATPELVAG